jgi:hypothetical protein
MEASPIARSFQRYCTQYRAAHDRANETVEA